MNETIRFLTEYDYWLLLGTILGRQACLPIPAYLIVVAAGALVRSDKLSPAGIAGLCILAFLVADLAWYGAGRKFGGKILHFACGLTRDSATCAHKATSAFDRHGVRILLVSKFIPGFDAVAAPLAGQSHVAVIRFLVFDGFGAAFWTGTYATLGYVFANQLDRIAVHLARVGALAAIAGTAMLGFYVLRRLARWLRFVRQFRLARITPEELRDQMNAGKDMLLVDLQKQALEGIPGAVRISPHVLERSKAPGISPTREVVLYCTCPSEFTSARVALALRRNGVACVRPLAGGLRAWRERGFPVTSKVQGLVLPGAVRV
jgi:membrane protein DedA with SNARE-associated domain/rhodanese-related sulfurtransferase